MQSLCNRLHTLSLSAAVLVCAGCASTPASSPSSTTTQAVVAVAPGRGMWFWESAAQQAIVSTPSAQDQTIASLKAWNVTSLYGSYGSQIISSPALVRAWNAKLAENGIASYSLASEGDFFLPEKWSLTQAWLQANFLDFNQASSAGQGFVGIAFDVEPASFPGNATELSWNVASPATRRIYLTDFNNMLQSARSLLNANGASSALIQTYLVTWWSTLNASIAWADMTDRNQWYAQLAQICDRITVEEYETNSVATISSQFQASNTLLNGKARVALNSADTVWASPTLFWQGVTGSEAQTSGFVDIEDYDTTTN
jgi:hypothetical protein